jgi:hypothetical protein
MDVSYRFACKTTSVLHGRSCLHALHALHATEAMANKFNTAVLICHIPCKACKIFLCMEQASVVSKVTTFPVFRLNDMCQMSSSPET